MGEILYRIAEHCVGVQRDLTKSSAGTQRGGNPVTRDAPPPTFSALVLSG